jgi:glutathione S-transferase
MKASAMVGYAGLLCEPRIQNIVTRYAVLKRLTGKTMVPVLRRGERAINDSTEIARYVIEHSETPLLPAEDLEPLSWILEDFFDEWVTRWVIFSRWFHRRDMKKLQDDIAEEFAWGLPVLGTAVGKLASYQLKSAGWPVGIREQNRDSFERSRHRVLQGLEQLFEEGPPFLFNAHPTVADFGLFGPLFQYRHDPTGSELCRLYPNARGYIQRLNQYRLDEAGPSINGFKKEQTDHAESRQLSELRDLFAEFLGTYWRILVKNYRVYSRDGRGQETQVELLDGSLFEFTSSGYFVGRLKFILGQVNDAYRKRERLLGDEGLALEEAFMEHIERLADFEEGVELLSEYEDIHFSGTS